MKWGTFERITDQMFYAETLEYVEEEGRGPTCINLLPTSFDLYAVLYATSMSEFAIAIIEKIYE
jgi:hypothetical protein